MEPSAILMFVVFVAFGAALALATLWEKRRARRIESDLKQHTRGVGGFGVVSADARGGRRSESRN